MAKPNVPGEQRKELGPAPLQNEDVSEEPHPFGLTRKITGPFQVLGAFFVCFNVWLVTCSLTTSNIWQN